MFELVSETKPLTDTSAWTKYLMKMPQRCMSPAKQYEVFAVAFECEHPSLSLSATAIAPHCRTTRNYSKPISSFNVGYLHRRKSQACVRKWETTKLFTHIWLHAQSSKSPIHLDNPKPRDRWNRFQRFYTLYKRRTYVTPPLCQCDTNWMVSDLLTETFTL